MTKEELIAKLKELGLSGLDGLKDEALEKVEAWLDTQKASLDTETRRKVRFFWIWCTAVGSVLGGVAGWFLRGLMG